MAGLGMEEHARMERRLVATAPAFWAGRGVGRRRRSARARPRCSIRRMLWGPRRARRLAAVLSGSHDALDDVERRRQAVGDRVQAKPGLGCYGPAGVWPGRRGNRAPQSRRGSDLGRLRSAPPGWTRLLDTTHCPRVAPEPCTCPSRRTARCNRLSRRRPG